MADEIPRLRSQRAMAIRHHGIDSPQAREALQRLTEAKLQRAVDAAIAAGLTRDGRTRQAIRLLNETADAA